MKELIFFKYYFITIFASLQLQSLYSHSMQFQDEKSNLEDQNIEDILEDIQLNEDSVNFCFVKKDNTIFIVDCSPQIMTPLAGQKISQFDKVMESYKNFMMSKVIANCNDRVGLIFYNVSKKSNSLNFPGIFTVHKLDSPSAKMINSVDKIKKDFVLNYGYSDQKISLHQVLWLFGQEIKDCDSFKNHVRLFLFTAQDTPHTEADQRRDQTINHARQLAAKGAHIQLFPIRKSLKARFDLRKFYQQVITFDADDLNKNLLDNSSKIMDLQARIRQKEFKKRTLNRLLMQIGEQSFIGVQIYALYSKSRRPLCKKLDASTNKPLKRVVKRLNCNGQVLYNEQIGTFYPLGGQRIVISKEDMNKIKTLKKPGITLIGFKPKRLIKPYHNLRPSYFLYPDQEHVTGSCQFFDALIDQLTQTEQIAIVCIMPRINQQLRFGALFPQKESYDPQDHHQTPPGFHMIILPYSDDIVNFAGGQKTIAKPVKVSMQLLKLTKLLVNNLTVSEFDFRDFQNPSLQKFYCHLQAHALNQQVVEQKKDTLLPDSQGFDQYSDIFKMVEQTADAEVQQQQTQTKKTKRSNSFKKDQKKEQENFEDQKRKSKRQSKSKDKKQQTDVQRPQFEKKSKVNKKQVKKEVKEEDNSQIFNKVHNMFEDGLVWKLSNQDLAEYLRIKGLNCLGTKEELADRIMLFMSYSL